MLATFRPLDLHENFLTVDWDHFPIDSQIGNGVYRLRLPLLMSRLHPVFNVVKLSLAPPDPIPGRRTTPPPFPDIVDGEEEWVVEEILDSRMVNQKLRYLISHKIECQRMPQS